MALADREWRLVAETANDGPTNMALDEVAAETAAAGGPRTVRVYGWEPSTLSLGYHQPAETVDWDFCEQAGIPVVRRPTGGGGIYHDEFGDISYSIVVPADEVPGELLESYSLLLQPILEAFDRMGIEATVAEEDRPAIYEPACYLRAVHPAHDVVVDGRKISGNAQHRTRDAVVQHGSITFSLELERHLGCFASPPDPESFVDRVTSITEQVDVDRHEAIQTVEGALAEWSGADAGSFDEAERERAREIADATFDSREWTMRH